MIPADFEYELKLINKELSLKFNKKLCKWQIRRPKKVMRKCTAYIRGEKYTIYYSDVISTVISTLSNDELDWRELNFIKENEWLNKRIATLKRMQEAIRNNEALQEKQDNGRSVYHPGENG